MKNGIVLLLFFVSFLSFGQQTEVVDFIDVFATLQINPVIQNVKGKIIYTFVEKVPVDSIRIDAHNMTFSNVKINGNLVAFKSTKQQLILFEGFRIGTNELIFEYEARPKQALYFVNWNFTQEIDTPIEVQGQIWTQGQGKYTSHWFPSFDDVNEKVIFNLDISFEKSFEVVSNGILKDKIIKEGEITWQYRMKKPMSSYLLMLAIGHFEKRILFSKSGIPLEQYYKKKEEYKVEPTYRYGQLIFDFFEKEIGVPYPWEVYRQIPVMDFLYAGMENTSATLFSDDFIVDKIGFFDKNYINAHAHELAHQWFGNLVTAVSSKHHWLQEGFATYYALLAEKEIYGEDHFNWELFKTFQQLKEASETDTIPLLDAKASSLTFYQKGAWALHVLREGIGEDNFRIAVCRYLEKNAYQNVTTENFFLEIEKISDFDLITFQKVWLETPGFNDEEAKELLIKNKFMQSYFVLEKKRILPLEEKYKEFEKILKANDIYYPLKVEVLNQLQAEPFETKEKLLMLAMQSKDLKVRQAVVSSLNEIPEKFRLQYETLLEDQSYITQEVALFRLWEQFPEHRLHYLQKSKGWIGFQDRNLELLRLALALATPEYKEESKKELYYQLLRYTGTDYDTAIRQNALEKLLSLKLISRDVLKSLIYTTTSHRWQFSKFGREKIRMLLKEEKYKKIFESLLSDLMEKEFLQLKKLLIE